jgi:chromosomal replication initiation ATPase DnaA
LVVENLTPENNNEALFHLFNIFNNEAERWILFTAEKAPAQMKFALKDLQTRLNMLPCVAISEPDDMMLQMLIVKLFNDRQLKITPEILQYIMNYAPRSFAYTEELVAEIDKISLASQSSVTYTVVRQAMEILALRNQREPDLFDDY